MPLTQHRRVPFAEVEDIAADVEVDQKVDIAGRPVLSADEGTEDAHIARSMLLRQFEDRGTLFGLQRVERHGDLSLLCLNNHRRSQNDDTTVVKVVPKHRFPSPACSRRCTEKRVKPVRKAIALPTALNAVFGSRFAVGGGIEHGEKLFPAHGTRREVTDSGPLRDLDNLFTHKPKVTRSPVAVP